MIFLMSGKAESGKDTFTTFLREYFRRDKYLTGQKAYADEVRNIARSMGWDGKKDERGRNLLQFIGDTARQYRQDIWIRHMISSLNERNPFWRHITFITDCRYPNEVEMIKTEFPEEVVLSVRIIRPNHVSSLTQEQLNNPSETSLDDFPVYDFIIVNDGDLDKLRLEAERVFHIVKDKFLH